MKLSAHFSCILGTKQELLEWNQECAEVPVNL